jgi:hypothetical protein
MPKLDNKETGIENSHHLCIQTSSSSISVCTGVTIIIFLAAVVTAPAITVAGVPVTCLLIIIVVIIHLLNTNDGNSFQQLQQRKQTKLSLPAQIHHLF